ncbi:SusC/RagA family TonB-linked outer membrane protein [Niastella caeni]|uniref:SusC/RagA family TonB-linked outer membrane protein n=1 Tax=Niastella caeni TaxID=2569763 RepID=A0A4S8HZC8_9BACT|nr:SusC/RagA family TonB-linked outer membrane protein [Niastella caeni]THU40199.1 SusC/RagA family TonB-linked outer membrane protein [Niastella caeni]
MRHLFLMIFVFLITASGAMAQQFIKGKVTDEKGAPVVGATINVKASATGTFTDAAGTFHLKIPSDVKTLVVTALGFAVKEIQVTSETEYNISLTLDTEHMNEIVVVAYGTARKQSLTGAVATVSATSLEKRPLTNAIAALEGAAAGIQVNNTVGQPGSSPTVRIRGFASVNYTNDPLYVIDGVPFGGNVADINPADIETISVLKDAASSALYGSRASNGVIIMTTKKGGKSNSSLHFAMNQGAYDKGINEYQKMNANQFMETMWKGYRNYLRSTNPGTYPTDDAAGAKATQSLISDYLKLNIYNKPDNALFDANGKLVSDAQIIPGYADDMDWYRDYERLGQRSDYNLSGRAGSEKNSLYFSLGYLDEKGYIKYSDFKRFSGRINAELQAAKWLKYGFNIGATHQVSNNTPASTSSSTSFVNPIYFSRNIAPIYPVHLHAAGTGDYILDALGNRQYDEGSTSRNQFLGRHAIWENELNKDQFFRNTLMGQAYVNINFLNDFTLGVTADMNARSDDEQVYSNAVIGDGAGNNGRASRNNYRYRNYTVRESLTWNKKLNAHTIDVMVGHENFNYDYNYLYAYKTNESFANGVQLENFTNISSLTDYKDVYRTEAYFSRARYNYADKYFIDGSYRKDASSKFFGKWGNFFSVGGSWMISREPFFETLVDKVNTLKLRTSYGEVGSDAGLGYYAWMSLYDMNQNGNAAALYKRQNANKDLIWETSASYGAAIEGRVFGRANFMLEYFDKQSHNLIFDVNLPLSAGATSSSSAVSVITKNIGSVSNRGWEFTFDVDVVRTRDFRFNLGANATFMKNRVMKLPDENRENGIINGTKKIMEGHSIYDFWLPQFVGVDQMTGNALYLPDTVTYTSANPIPAQYVVTINGQTYTTYTTYAKRDWSGSAIPNVFGSVTSTFSYKNITLAGLFTYAVGGKTYDNSYVALMSMSGNPSALHTNLLNAWDGVPKDMTATSADRIAAKGVPVVDFFRSDKNNATSTQFLQNGSYFVVKNVNLSYKLPKELLSAVSLKSLSVGVSAENLYTGTKLKGMNPQQSYTGIIENAFVTPRILSFMLNVGL